MIRCGVLLLLMLAAPAYAQTAPPQPTLRSGLEFTNDFFQGLATGPVVTQSGRRYIGLVQSKPNASPLPKDIAPVVEGLIHAYLNHQAERYADFVLPGRILYIHDVLRTPREFGPDGFPFEFEGKLTANAPYYLTKMSAGSLYNVRVEWLVDGQLAFLTWLEVAEGKVLHVIVDAAKPPPLPREAYDPPVSTPTSPPAGPAAK
jgi:hypothetical protein